MKIKHTVNISRHAPECYTGGTELEAEISVQVTSWDRDDYGRCIIEDLEFDQVELHDEAGEPIIAEGELEQAILEAVEEDDDFIAKIYAVAEHDKQENLLEAALARRDYV